MRRGLGRGIRTYKKASASERKMALRKQNLAVSLVDIHCRASLVTLYRDGKAEYNAGIELSD